METTDQTPEAFGFSDLPGAVNSAADANKYLYVIKKLEKERREICKEWNDVLDETERFYEKKEKSKLNAIDFFSSKIEAYVRASAKNLSLPNGRAMIKKVRSPEWASDQELLEYSRAHNIPLRIKESPDKEAIKEFVGEGESSVLSYTEQSKFYINLSSTDEEDK